MVEAHPWQRPSVAKVSDSGGGLHPLPAPSQRALSSHPGALSLLSPLGLCAGLPSPEAPPSSSTWAALLHLKAPALSSLPLGKPSPSF